MVCFGTTFGVYVPVGYLTHLVWLTINNRFFFVFDSTVSHCFDHQFEQEMVSHRTNGTIHYTIVRYASFESAFHSSILLPTPHFTLQQYLMSFKSVDCTMVQFSIQFIRWQKKPTHTHTHTHNCTQTRHEPNDGKHCHYIDGAHCPPIDAAKR